MPMRRPRIPEEMAERVDAVRGQVPFERWVRQAVENQLALRDEAAHFDPPVTVTAVRPVDPGDDVGLVEEKLVPTVAQLAGRTGLPRARCQRALDDGTWRDL